MNEHLHTLFLADAHTITRTSLRFFLEQKGYRIVGEAKDAAGALQWIPAAMPDIVLMGLSFPDLNGIDLAKKLIQGGAQSRLIALTMHDESEYLLPFLQAGGMGYVHKAAACEELLAAIEAVMRDEIYISQHGAQILAKAQKSADPSAACLSSRETEVLHYVARGFTCREIGEKLFLSVRTVETYRMRLMHKLKLKNRSELVDYAARHHII